MREILPVLVDELTAGRSIALATVIGTVGSAPILPGAAMLVTTSGEVHGSVSGGCVEAAVYQVAEAVLAGADPVVEHYGFSDADALSVGLTCGGELDVFVERVSPDQRRHFDCLALHLGAGESVATALLVDDESGHVGALRMMIAADGSTSGSLGSPELDAVVGDELASRLKSPSTGVITVGARSERTTVNRTVFVSTHAAPARLVIFGASDFASALAVQGSMLGYRVTVCDARPAFANARRFPAADEVLVEWPHRYLRDEILAGRVDGRTAVCVLTHDHKFDVPVLEVALGAKGIGYVGAMGSRRTHTDRLERLRGAGLQPDDLARLHSPIGLDLGAQTPEETAVSIMGEILRSRSGRSGRSLAETTGQLHATAPNGIAQSSCHQPKGELHR